MGRGRPPTLGGFPAGGPGRPRRGAAAGRGRAVRRRGRSRRGRPGARPDPRREPVRACCPPGGSRARGRAGRLHRLRGAGRRAGDGRTAALSHGGAARRAEFRPHDPRTARGGGGPGLGVHRGVAGPRPRIRPGGGRRPRCPPGVVGGARPQGPRGGAVAGGLPARRPDNGPAGPGPARRARPGGGRRASGGPPGAAGGAGPAGGCAARRAGAGRAGPRAGDRRRRGQRSAPRTAPLRLDPPGPGRGRAAVPGHGGTQSVWPARPRDRAGHPVRGGRAAGRLPRAGGPADGARSAGRAARADARRAARGDPHRRRLAGCIARAEAAGAAGTHRAR